MTPRLLAPVLLLPLVLGLASCGDPVPKPSPNAAMFPAALFVGGIDAPFVHVDEAKKSAKEGDTVTLHGVVGGRKNPFISGRAVFMLVDTKLHPCKDCCNTPWDFCCDTQSDIAANAATVQVVDAEGAVIRSDIHGMKGIAPGALVTVTGTVAKRETPATITVNAAEIVVHGG